MYDQVAEAEAHADYISGALSRADYIATIATQHGLRSTQDGLRECVCLACSEVRSNG